MTDHTALVEVHNLTTMLGSFKAVDDVSFNIKSGSITGLIGPNGAGKTTLFKTMNGIEKPASGVISFQNKVVSGLEPDEIFRTGMAHTFQIPRPFPKMSVLENLMLAAPQQSGESFLHTLFRPGKVSAEEKLYKEKAEDILSFTNLSQMASEAAGSLSGGQQKLLELARVLMGDPALIMLDEPAAGVNPTLTRSLIEKIHELNDRGITFFIIEHDMDFIMSHCHPIIGMASGKIVFEGDSQSAMSDTVLLDAYLGEVAHG